MKKTVLTFGLIAASLPALADEGMWTLENFPSATVREKYGADINDAWLDRIRQSVARLDNGCSASFVSPQGLLLTNHHCALRCIADNSTAEADLEADGFLAERVDDELSCPAVTLSVLVDTTEITKDVQEGIAQESTLETGEARRRVLKRLVSACEKDSDFKCEAKPLYRGGQYWMYRYKRYTDIRLAFAPETDIAAFGGDPDNFNFPRWSLDMTLLRAYENGRPASTPHYLEWRSAGVAPGDVLFVAGRPGSTQRLLTLADLRFFRDVILPPMLLRYSELRGRLIQFSKTGEEARRIASPSLQRIENSIKVLRKRLDALHSEDLMAQKAEDERKLEALVAADGALAEATGTPWKDIEDANERALSFYEDYLFIERGAAFGGSLFKHARHLIRWAAESEKPNQRRLKEYTDERAARLKLATVAEKPVYAELEKLQLAFSLDKMREYLGPDSTFVKSILGNRTPDEIAESLVSATRLADAAVRAELWEASMTQLRTSSDPMIQFALSVDDQARALRKRYEDELESPSDLAYEKIARARFAILGTDAYPDANFTLRITYGTHTGWREKGKDVRPWTTVSELFPRVTGKSPFALPTSWQEAQRSLPGDVKFNFVGTTDVIGGNSGSPAVDADGKLVGLVFDGNIHSISGAYWFDEARNRTVFVHPEIMLESMRLIYGADELLGEMGLH